MTLLKTTKLKTSEHDRLLIFQH